MEERLRTKSQEDRKIRKRKSAFVLLLSPPLFFWEQPERGGGGTNRGEASMRNNNNDNNFEGKRRTKEAVKRIMRADLEVITSKVSPAKIKTPTIINLLGKKLPHTQSSTNPRTRTVLLSLSDSDTCPFV
ncbi:unnamed protein product [Brassica napus]|uniref:(rape) hypothetical protein n=1 Tax=Brassica napus TaxID=3708 RepID=A0A816J072_BRANA|nr:unnamed protein product [Brassica napus]